jgi:YebC/PmpR family DNA-binding regulatory protein
MSGHNKWSQIKHKKAKEDSKRGYAFTKLIKEITLAARDGGDPAGNARLRSLIEKAKEINMPIDNIKRAIQRGTGELQGVNYEPYTYEGYGPYSMAVIVDTLSDNKNRTVASLRYLFTKQGGNLGESGSVSWMFEKLGVIKGTSKSLTEDELLEQLIDYDIKEIEKDNDLFLIYCDPKAIDAVKQAAKSAGIHVENADTEWIAKTPLALSDEQSQKALEFLSALQDHEDVQNVYANLG